jgi:hypothetical protein
MNKGQAVYQGTPLGVIEYFNNEIKMNLEGKANPADAFMHRIEEYNHLLAHGVHKSKDADSETNRILNRDLEAPAGAQAERSAAEAASKLEPNQLYARYDPVCGKELSKLNLISCLRIIFRRRIYMGLVSAKASPRCRSARCLI